jgi:D-glycero-D-manno-heptose 1,7-bisphosphate phosphatase
VGIGEVTGDGTSEASPRRGLRHLDQRRAVILDRDGTLIDVFRDEESGTISTAFHPDQIAILPGVLDGLHLLAQEGYLFAIATNQPGPAKGQFSAAAVKRTNDAIVARLAAKGIAIAQVEACMHHPDGGPGGDASLVGPCVCRKPKAGMLETIAGSLGLDRTRTWMVGDSAADVEAGASAGMRTGLVFPKNRCELCPLREGVREIGKRTVPTVHGATLLEVARAIVAEDRAQR